eukprot:gene16312-19401_t
MTAVVILKSIIVLQLLTLPFTWSLFRNHEYSFHTTPKTPTEAEIDCMSRLGPITKGKGYMATITSTEENNYLLGTLPQGKWFISGTAYNNSHTIYNYGPVQGVQYSHLDGKCTMFCNYQDAAIPILFYPFQVALNTKSSVPQPGGWLREDITPQGLPTTSYLFPIKIVVDGLTGGSSRNIAYSIDERFFSISDIRANFSLSYNYLSKHERFGGLVGDLSYFDISLVNLTYLIFPYAPGNVDDAMTSVVYNSSIAEMVFVGEAIGVYWYIQDIVLRACSLTEWDSISSEMVMR